MNIFSILQTVAGLIFNAAFHPSVATAPTAVTPVDTSAAPDDEAAFLALVKQSAYNWVYAKLQTQAGGMPGSVDADIASVASTVSVQVAQNVGTDISALLKTAGLKIG